MQDSPSGFWKMDESSGSIAYDSSGCGNNGSYIGPILNTPTPIVCGGISATKITNTNYLQLSITKDFSLQNGVGGFGTSTTSDNDFSIEVWFHPKTITGLTPILADTSGVGIYWDNGNILFKLENEEVYYSVPNPKRSMHVVGVYSVKAMLLYLNGVLVASKAISRINFTNESLSFNIGPSSVSEYFIVDAPAIYRYSLNQNLILKHYNSFFSNTENNIVLTDSGELFKGSEKYQNIASTVSFPAQLDWQYHVSNDLLYRENTNSLYLNPSSSYAEFIKVISFPHWRSYISSKIEWSSSNGVSLDVSSTGDPSSWQECINGEPLPGFKQGSNFSNNKVIYLRARFSSINSEIYIPELYYIKIHFYSDKALHSHNGSSFISTLETSVGDYWDISISNNHSNILLRENDNGVTALNSPFYINTQKDILSLEMIFRPKSLGSGYLFFNKNGSVESYISWTSNGVISKSNISNLYINGQDISLENNISEFLYIDEPNYVLIKTLEPLSDQIWINGKQENTVRTGVLDNNNYQNIAIYESSDIDHLNHYNLYTGKDIIQASDSVIQITEEAVKTYSRDRVLLNNI